MFEPTSRYANLPDATFTVLDPEGQPRIIVYKRRRWFPDDEDATVLLEHAVVQGERLDHITARFLGEPTLFWRVCDANGVLQPAELEETGRTVRISLPGF